jgi:hypothetical protein
MRRRLAADRKIPDLRDDPQGIEVVIHLDARAVTEGHHRAGGHCGRLSARRDHRSIMQGERSGPRRMLRSWGGFPPERPWGKPPCLVCWLKNGRRRELWVSATRDAAYCWAEVDGLGTIAVTHDIIGREAWGLGHWVPVHGPIRERTTVIQRVYILERWAPPFIGHLLLRDTNRVATRQWRTELLAANAPSLRRSGQHLPRVLAAWRGSQASYAGRSCGTPASRA